MKKLVLGAIVFLACTSAAFSQPTKYPPSDTLTQCVLSKMVDKYSSARETAYNSCPNEVQVWLKACFRLNTSCPKDYVDACTDGQATNDCEQGLRMLGDSIDKTWSVSHPIPPRPTDPRLDSAMRDLYAHKSLPGLPSMKKPVYVTARSLICSSAGALSNPNKDVLIVAKACIVVGHPMKVSLLPPIDQQQYIDDHYWQMIAITWHSGDVSDGNTYSGWVKISDLRN